MLETLRSLMSCSRVHCLFLLVFIFRKKVNMPTFVVYLKLAMEVRYFSGMQCCMTNFCCSYSNECWYVVMVNSRMLLRCHGMAQCCGVSTFSNQVVLKWDRKLSLILLGSRLLMDLEEQRILLWRLFSPSKYILKLDKSQSYWNRIERVRLRRKTDMI